MKKFWLRCVCYWTHDHRVTYTAPDGNSVWLRCNDCEREWCSDMDVIGYSILAWVLSIVTRLVYVFVVDRLCWDVRKIIDWLSVIALYFTSFWLLCLWVVLMLQGHRV